MLVKKDKWAVCAGTPFTPRRQRQTGLYELEVILVYEVSSRLARAMVKTCFIEMSQGMSG